MIRKDTLARKESVPEHRKAGQSTLSGPCASFTFDTTKRVSPPLHVGWWVATAAVLLVMFNVVSLVVTNPSMEWDIVAEYFTSRDVLLGLLRTLELTAVAMAIGIAGGILLAVMQMSHIPVISWGSKAYVWLLRGTPLLVQILFWYNIAFLVPYLAIGVPGGPNFIEVDTNDVITPYLAAILALALNEAAYMAEVVRGGLLSVDAGQNEAAKSLGMKQGLTLRRIIIPQALRVIIPPTGNQVISMLKASSLVSVIAMPELLYSVQIVYNNTFQTIPLLVVASIWYLIVTSILYVFQYYLERRFSRGDRRTLPPTPLQRFRAALGGPRPSASSLDSKIGDSVA